VAAYSAIAATTHGVLRLLENATASPEWTASGGPPGVVFEAFGAAKLQKPPEGAPKVSLYLYRVALSSVRRHIGPRVDSNGKRYRPSIPLDLHYLLTAWAVDPLLQQQLLGWCIAMLDETPVLPAALLNSYRSGQEIFHQGETVELIWQPLPWADLSDVWEVAKSNQQPSASYLARMVQLDSSQALEEFPLVQTREFDYSGVEA
jgi:hypothetical protein